MASLVCSNCGKEHYYHAYRGSKITDLRSPCCKFPAAKGIMVSVEENNIHDVWGTLKKKIYIIGGRLQFASYPAKVNFFQDDGVYIWFVEANPSDFRPDYIRPEWVGYYKISKQTLARVGWSAAEQKIHPTNGGLRVADSLSNPATIGG